MHFSNKLLLSVSTIILILGSVPDFLTKILPCFFISLVALEVLFSLRKGKKASQILKVFKPLPQILENIVVKDKNIISKFKCKVAIKKAKKIMDQKGRILVRKSGTEPKIRIMAESYDKSLVLKCIKIIKSSIK